MQDDGYEIVDVKITVIQNQGLVGEMEKGNTGNYRSESVE